MLTPSESQALDRWLTMTPEEDKVYRTVKRGDGFRLPARGHQADCGCNLCDRFKYE